MYNLPAVTFSATYCESRAIEPHAGAAGLLISAIKSLFIFGKWTLLCFKAEKPDLLSADVMQFCSAIGAKQPVFPFVSQRSHNIC